MATYQYRAGLQNVGSYQVSGKPFVTGAVNCGNTGGPVKIQFPNVLSTFCRARGALFGHTYAPCPCFKQILQLR